MLSSNATCFTPFEFSHVDVKYYLKDDLKVVKKRIADLEKALTFTEIKDRYKIWMDYFTWEDYEDHGFNIEFPDLLENWEKEIQRLLDKYVKEKVSIEKSLTSL